MPLWLVAISYSWGTGEGELEGTGEEVTCIDVESEITHKYSYLGVVHNCQYLNECTKHTFSDPPPLQKVYISTFFKWIICHENDKKKNGLKC